MTAPTNPTAKDLRRLAEISEDLSLGPRKHLAGG